MSWRGSTQGTNNSLKSNRELLGNRKKLFTKEETYFKAKREYEKVAGGIENIKDLSETERNIIKNKIRNQQKKEKKILNLIFLVTLPFFYIGNIYYNNISH